MKQIFHNVDQYILSFPNTTQKELNKIRQLILSIAPNAIEFISYGMPAYKLNKKPVVYFAGYTKHIGLYATPNSHEKFSKELSAYKQGKGSVQFPLSSPLPYKLIEAIVKYRVDCILEVKNNN